jgi:hypothetical protein
MQEKGCLKKVVKDRLPKWPPLGDPRPEEILKFVNDMATIDIAGVDNTLAITKLAHGKFYDQALL